LAPLPLPPAQLEPALVRARRWPVLVRAPQQELESQQQALAPCSWPTPQQALARPQAGSTQRRPNSPAPLRAAARVEAHAHVSIFASCAPTYQITAAVGAPCVAVGVRAAFEILLTIRFERGRSNARNTLFFRF